MSGTWIATTAAVIVAGLCLLFVRLHAVNVPFWDEFEVPALLRIWRSGHLTFGSLWVQHNEHRLLIPHAILIALAALFRCDTRAPMYFGWLTLVAVTAICLADFRPIWRNRRWAGLAFVIPAVLLFSPRQQENLLWGYQIQFFLCEAFAVGAFALLASSWRRPLGVGAAIGCAVLGSYSFSTGLALWPIGALYLAVRAWSAQGHERRRAWVGLALWILVAGAAIAAYLHGYVRPSYHPDPLGFLHAPAASLKYLATLLGSPFASKPRAAFNLGLCSIAVVLLALAALATRAVPLERAGIGPALILFGLGSAVLIMAGRSGFGIESALWSRYTTFTALAMVGAFRVLLALSRPTAAWRAGQFAAILVLVIGFANMLPAALTDAATLRADRIAEQNILRCYRIATADQLHRLAPVPAAELVPMAQWLEQEHLSVFDRACDPRSIGH